MNDQPPIIVSSTPAGPGPSAAPPRKTPNFMLVLLIVLFIGAAGFGYVAITASAKAQKATTSLEAAKSKAASDARALQKTEDDKQNTLANSLPYRNYTAPTAFGGFTINFPKNWSSSVDEELSSQTQVILTLNPNFIKRVNNTDDLVAAKIELIQKPVDQFIKQYITTKGINQSATKVAGISGTQLTGGFTDKRTTRIVAVPVRDKTLVFINENSAYASTFDTILAQAKINP
jgi:hypothetical protein